MSFDSKSQKKQNGEVDFTAVDTRTLKRLKQIISMTPQERQILYKTIDGILAGKKKK